MFEPKNEISEVALNILKKRYFSEGETSWDDVVQRVTDFLFDEYLEDIEKTEEFYYTKEMLRARYFIPNSPCLVNAGKRNGGLSACFVVDFPDTIEGIYKTKLDFALIAKKGGGCGTTLTKLRPENSSVEGSTHGYAGGPVKFFDTICHDMKAMTQAGFREMAMMGTMSVYHPDIVKFITAKTEEGKMHTTNISVVVDDSFMNSVKNDGDFTTYFDFEDGRKFFQSYKAREIFNMIVEGAWKNGEPGLIFYDKVNNSPYKYSNQDILATNPCGEQGLPFNGVCNLGSLDISKFLKEDNSLDLNKLEVAVRLSIRFLDRVITKNKFPTEDIHKWAMDNRPVGLGIMGLADYYLSRGVAYGSPQALEELEFILAFMYKIAEDESISLGELYGVPEACKSLPIPRRNITLLSIAPTGTISLLAGCNSSIEPIFSELTTRNDKTGTYQFDHEASEKDYFRCAVSTNGGREVTWEEHVQTQASAQKFVDSGVSKTINFPNHTHRETVGKAFILAWELGCKGITVYRNGSRQKEVLSPKLAKKDECPICKADLIRESGCKKCSKCDFSLCEIG